MLLALVVALALIDAVRTDYALDPIPLMLMLGSALVLLGVEAGKKLLGGS